MPARSDITPRDRGTPHDRAGTPASPRAVRPPFTLCTLGGLELRRGDALLGEPGRKPLAVLAVVAMEPQRIARVRLAALLWPNSPPERARHTLTQTLYALRQECGATLVEGSTHLAVDPALLECDAERFLRAVELGDHEGALALYRGDFLDGVAYPGCAEFEHWTDRVRSRLAAAYRVALVAAADAVAARGDGGRAIAWLEEGVARYPDDASLVERLARVHSSAAEPHRARMTIDRYARWLQEEYEAPLPEALVTLRRELQRAPAPVATSVPTPIPRPIEPPGVDFGESRLPDVAHAAPPYVAETYAPALVATAPRRRWGRGALVGALALLVAIPLVLVLSIRLMREPEPERMPLTLEEDAGRSLLAVHQARPGAVDSGVIGQVLLLPAIAPSGDPRALEMAESLDRGLRSYGRLRPILTSFVSAKDSDSLVRAVEANRMSRTSEQETIEMFARTEVPLLIRPLVSVSGETFSVGFQAFRDLTRYGRSGRGGPIEMEQFGHFYTASTNRALVRGTASQALYRFLRSMESCARVEHVEFGTAPWCWRSRSDLQVVPDSKELRREHWAKVVEARRTDEQRERLARLMRERR